MNTPSLSRLLAVSGLFTFGMVGPLSAQSAPEPVVITDLALTLGWVAPGSLPGPASGDPARTVKEGFWLARTELTQLQWKALMDGNNPSRYFKDDHPVQQVSWLDCLDFCERLNRREKEAGRLPEGYFYTLPTEIQWEYAARAGDETDGSSTVDAQGWTAANSSNRMQQVATKQANAWGFFDMRGNVWEFCQETPGSTSKGRFVRGGSSRQEPINCGYTSRMELSLHARNLQYGLRLALSRDRLVKPTDIPPPQPSDAPPPTRSQQRPAPTPTPTPVPTPTPAPKTGPVELSHPKTTQTVGGLRIEASRLLVLIEDRGAPVDRKQPTPTPTPAPGESRGAVMGPFSVSGPMVLPDPPRDEFKSSLAKDLQKHLPGRHAMVRSGQGGRGTHADSFNELIHHAKNHDFDAILWVTDLNSPIIFEEVQQLANLMTARKISLHIISTECTASENTPYRKSASSAGRFLMDVVRQSGGGFRLAKLKR